MEKTQNAIDSAIDDCKEKIKHHRLKSNRMLVFVSISLIYLASISYSDYYINRLYQKETRETILQTRNDMNRVLESYYTLQYIVEKNNGYAPIKDSIEKATIVKQLESIYNDIPTTLAPKERLLDSSLQYILYGIFVLIFSVLISLYRFHLKEVQRYEHFLFGLLRIRIAANNSDLGFGDEVRTALVKDAFSLADNSIFKKDKKIESPIQGHPTSDITTLILNKIIETVDITAKPKPPNHKT